MSENSNPNHRPISVVSFLAAHPTQVFTLAEIERQLGLSKGSTHRVMTALTEAGFVTRHPRHKTYSLGMALVAIGQAALERYPGIAIARREMSRLAAELGVGAALSAIANNEYFLLAREGLPRSNDGLTLVGERRHVVPPIGIGQLAWRSGAELAEYLDRGAGYMPDEIRQHLLAACGEIRRRGYSAAANGAAMWSLMQAAVIPVGQHGDSTPQLPLAPGQFGITPAEFQLLHLSDAGASGVNYLAAPVFSPEAEVLFEIVVSGFAADLPLTVMEQHAARLVQAAEAVTKEIRGRKPA